MRSKSMRIFTLPSFMTLLILSPLMAVDAYEIKDQVDIKNIGEIRFWMEETKQSLGFHVDQIKNLNLPTLSLNEGNFGFIDRPLWLYFDVTNKSINQDLFIITFPFPYYDELDFYEWDSNGKLTKEIHTGDERSFSSRDIKSRYFSFETNIARGERKQYAVRIQSAGRINIYFWIHSLKSFIDTTEIQTLLLGIYFGSVFVMIVYNGFLFISIKDISYLIYIIYLCLVFFVSLSYNGLANQYLWPEANFYSSLSVPHGGVLLSFVALIFSYVFLEIGNVKQKFLKYLTWILIFVNLVFAVSAFWLPLKLNASIANFFSGLVVAFYLLALSIFRLRTNIRQAKYFLVAWVVPIVIVISITIYRRFLPLNQIIDEYAENLAFFVEMVFFSLSLADRINILRREKLEIVREQNYSLESKIQERTRELEGSMKALAEAQETLIRSEKMAVLGQLISGIGHEINNPIGAIKSSCESLSSEFNDILEKKDQFIFDYQQLSENEKIFLTKMREQNPLTILHESSSARRSRKKLLEEELNARSVHLTDDQLSFLTEQKINSISDELLDILSSKNIDKIIDLTLKQATIEKNLMVIANSVKRASKIIFALKSYNYHNLDEEPVMVDLNQSIEIVLSIYESQWKHRINIHKNFDTAFEIKAHPEELIQVWTNILHNAFQAIETTGNVWINIFSADDKVMVEITDDGPGIEPSLQEKVFEPFFTTKKYGSGSGLGLDIVRRLVINMGGTISLSSIPGKTKFSFAFPAFSNGR